MKTLIIANWKLYLNNQETLALAESLAQIEISLPREVELVVCPMQTMVGAISRHPGISLGAQDLSWDSCGAYTGEVSPESLRDLGCEYALVGHSERRERLGENNDMVNRKIKAAQAAGLIPVLCLGEKYEVRQAGLTEEKVKKQLQEALRGVELSSGHLVVAYEPVWAIYPSKYEVAPSEVATMVKLLSGELEAKFGSQVFAQRCQIIYGGSVQADNLSKFLDIPGVTGALIGHASTKYDDFVRLIEQIPAWGE